MIAYFKSTPTPNKDNKKNSAQEKELSNHPYVIQASYQNNRYIWHNPRLVWGSIVDYLRQYWRDNTDKIYHIFELCLIAAIFFGIGVLFAQTILYKQPDIKFALDKKITEKNLASLQPEKMQNLIKNTVGSATKPAQTQSPAQLKGDFVASKNGKTYYKTTCSNRIKEENKIYFQSESDAQKSGFTPSKTCFKL